MTASKRRRRDCARGVFAAPIGGAFVAKIVLWALCGTATVTAAPVELWGYSADQNGSLWTIDPASGALDNGVAVGMAPVGGIAADADGQLYGLLTRLGPIANHLVRLDRGTGAITDIGNTGMDVYEGGLAFDPTSGGLYGIQHGPSDLTLNLFQIDKATGQATIIGPLSPTRAADFSALAFDEGGALYVLDTSNERLLHVDPSNAATLSSVDLSAPLGATAGMAFHPEDGSLYVADGEANATNQLYTLDVGTGQLTTVGPIDLDHGISGLTFVPEPASGLLLITGLVVFGDRRRRGRCG